jgi:tetratricopeptide (TPR) repeat protein
MLATCSSAHHARKSAAARPSARRVCGLRIDAASERRQNNLGLALSTLGERESGTTQLEQAVNAYRDALQERTRERVPLQWAMTQNNLGTALQTLGERESGTAWLEQAVDAFRNALEEFTEAHAQHYCSIAQRNLERALEARRKKQAGD